VIERGRALVSGPRVRPLWMPGAGALIVLALAYGFVQGGAWLTDELHRASAGAHVGAQAAAPLSGDPAPAPVKTDVRPPPIASSPIAVDAAVTELRARNLTIPVSGVIRDALVGSFTQARDGRVHEAIDILAARGTPVYAVEDGTIAKLFWSKAGGRTIYQFDPSGRYAYYYAHLDRYADGLAEKMPVARGTVIGYVGTTGNAPPGTPHLHFAIFKLGPEKRWWQGDPLDPYAILHGTP